MLLLHLYQLKNIVENEIFKWITEILCLLFSLVVGLKNYGF